jgi:hypothetical protein
MERENPLAKKQLAPRAGNYATCLSVGLITTWLEDKEAFRIIIYKEIESDLGPFSR